MFETEQEQAIRERLENATPGPWKATYHLPERSADAAFIAYAPDDIAYLLSELSAVRSREQALRARLAQKQSAWRERAKSLGTLPHTGGPELAACDDTAMCIYLECADELAAVLRGEGT